MTLFGEALLNEARKKVGATKPSASKTVSWSNEKGILIDVEDRKDALTAEQLAAVQKLAKDNCCTYSVVQSF